MKARGVIEEASDAGRINSVICYRIDYLFTSGWTKPEETKGCRTMMIRFASREINFH
jgi:hypothetical protein